METRQRESLRTTKDKGPDKDSEPDPSNRGKPKRGQEKTSRNSRRGGGSATWGGPAIATGILAEAERLVQGCGRLCAAARPSYTRTDHGVTGRPLQLCAIPGEEYSSLSQSSLGGQLGAYGGRDQGGCEESTEEQIRGAVEDEVQTPEWVASGVKAEKTRGGIGRGREDEEGGPTEPHWERLVDLIQTAFWEGDLAEEAMWQAVVLIPKGKKDYRGIGLVEVMWKVVAAI